MVCAVAATVLFAASRLVDFGALYINGLNGAMNDQIGYVSVARNLVDRGKLETSVIYPSILAQDTTKNYFYMPGHYLALAASFRVFGYSVRNAVLPNALAFLVSVVLVFYIARRLYGDGAAVLSSILFIVFPLNVVLALSVMSEMTLTAAALAALAIFVSLPARWKPFIGALLVVIPMCFRESAAIIAAPMFFLVLGDRDSGRSRWRSAALFALLSVAAVVLVMSSSIARGRPTLFINNLAGMQFTGMYTDAYSTESVDRSPANLRRLFAKKLDKNADLLVAPLLPEPKPTDSTEGERVAMWFLLAAIPSGLIAALIRRDAFAFGVAVATATLLILILLTYTVWAYRGVRVLLMMQPLISIVYGSLAARAVERRQWLVSALVTILAAVFIWHGVGYVTTIYEPQRTLDAKETADAQFVSTIGHDDRRVLVAQHDFVLRYMTEHHPVKWSFIPANLRTFRLLDQKYEIGTVMYPRQSPGYDLVPLEDLEREGFKAERTVTNGGQEILILRR